MSKNRVYSVDISVEAYDRTGLLGDISGLLSAMRVNVRKVNTFTDLQSNIANLRLTIEIHNIEELVKF